MDSGLGSIISDTGNDFRKSWNSLLEDNIEQKFSEIIVSVQAQNTFLTFLHKIMSRLYW